MIRRGTIVLVDVPYLDATASTRRPALIISDPSLMLDTVVAAITSRIRTPLPATHYMIDESHVDWKVSGLRLPSVIRFDRLFTIHNSDIKQTFGLLSPGTMQQLDAILAKALGL